jgi:hypothetical protein
MERRLPLQSGESDVGNQQQTGQRIVLLGTSGFQAHRTLIRYWLFCVLAGSAVELSVPYTGGVYSK